MKSKYGNLDILRSLAVLSVVTAHLYQQLVEPRLGRFDPAIDQFLRNLSFTGVMFFFVHTCLVLMLSLYRAPPRHRGRNFLVRRAFRIVPLCWATILISLLTGLTDEAGGVFRALGWRGITVNVLFVHNIVRGYSNVIGPLWSLDWEVQMYLLLPILFVAVKRFRGISTAFILWSASMLIAIIFTQPGVPRAFHAAVFPPMFLSGLVAYKLLERRSETPNSRLLPARFWPVFVLSLFVSQAWMAGTRSYESAQGIAIDACICLVAGIGISVFEDLRDGWILRLAHQIAKYSYGIYLLHILVIRFLVRYLPLQAVVWQIVLSVILTALVSIVSYHSIENPLIRVGKRLAMTKHGWSGSKPIRVCLGSAGDSTGAPGAEAGSSCPQILELGRNQ